MHKARLRLEPWFQAKPKWAVYLIMTSMSLMLISMTQTEPDTAAGLCKVMLVEDHPMFREHVGRLINRDLCMVVCGEADNHQDAIKLIGEVQPDIAIVDMTLRKSSGLDLLKELKAKKMATRVLVLSMHDEELFAESALRAGARGYICKNQASSELLHAIRRVMADELYVSKGVAYRLRQRHS